MKKEYDFSNAVKNPYAEKLRRVTPIDIDIGTVDYFKRLAADTDIPYQTLINLYLADCAAHNKKVSVSWSEPSTT